MSLFGSATIGADNRRLLLTLRAGRMFKNSQDNMIHADARSGILSFTMEASGVIEMKWEALAGDSKNASATATPAAPGNTNPPSESTVIMPGGAKFDRVTKCTTGRVFVIDFGTRQMFYWLQEQVDNERDQNYFRAIKNAVEGKTRQGAAGNSATPASGAGSNANASSSASAANQAGIQLAALQNILTNLHPNAAPPTSTTTTTTTTTNGSASPSPAHNAQSLAALMNQMTQRAGAVPKVSLQDVIRAQPAQDALRADPAFYMSRLFESLPPETDPAGDVMENVMNPQFASSASALSSALADPDGYREILHAFGLQAPAGIPPSPWGLLQAVLNEKPQEKNKTDQDAAPASKEGTNNNNGNSNGGNGDNTDAASV